MVRCGLGESLTEGHLCSYVWGCTDIGVVVIVLPYHYCFWEISVSRWLIVKAIWSVSLIFALPHCPLAPQLRIVYDNLSKDPNSLANLDQDLPNYAQHSIPIFSLPQASDFIGGRILFLDDKQS